jgi:putative cardiolipin synthase
VALADAAERNLDLRYYIYHGDDSGKLPARQVIAAADRGVRVRVLLDDFGLSAKDESQIALDGHSNIEVRVFNPLVVGRARIIGSLIDFPRATRQMHNKCFTADNQATIVGGPRRLRALPEGITTDGRRVVRTQTHSKRLAHGKSACEEFCV